MKSQHRRHLQSGFSLIELLISLTIGLVVLTAIGAVYVNTTKVMKQREDQADLNEPARIIMRMLRQDVMRAGYVDIMDATSAGGKVGSMLFDSKNESLANMYVRDTASGAVSIPTPISQLYAGLTPVFGCDGAIKNTPKAITDAAPPLTRECDTANATRNSLRIAYQGIPLTGSAAATGSLSALNTDTGAGLDCLQQATANGALVINDYFLRTTGGVSQFACRGSGAADAQDIAAGVEEFVVRYQMAAEGSGTSAAGGAQSAYFNAADVTASNQGWAGVTAVEVCIVSATDQTNRGPAASGTADLQPTRPTCSRDSDGVFDSNVDRAAGDLRLWKRFTSVISLRNSVFATPL